jgi:hypothetical protein
MSDEETLISAYQKVYSTSNRPRRQKRFPVSMRDTFNRFLEFPNGVYINKAGEIDPDVLIDSEEESDSWSDLSPRMKKKRRRIQREEEREEEENLKYDEIAKNEEYDFSTIERDSGYDMISKGNEEYVPDNDSEPCDTQSESDTEEIEYSNSDNEEQDELSCSDFFSDDDD